jgi:hypothetical protein
MSGLRSRSRVHLIGLARPSCHVDDNPAAQSRRTTSRRMGVLLKLRPGCEPGAAAFPVI